MKNEVIILGYDPARIAGGVSTVTDVILKGLPNVRLLPIKHCYGALDVWLYFRSLLKFAVIAWERRPVTHLIVGSKGDRVRAIPIILMAALLKFPLCIQYHKHLPALLFGYSFFDRLVDRVFRLCDHHVFLSKNLEHEFKDRLGDCVTHVIGNALSDAWMNLPVVPRSKRRADIVFCGRWNKEKGIELLCQYLLRSYEYTTCEIYTDFPNQLSIPGTVVKSWASDSELRAAISRAALVVLPSYHEAYPTVLLEAMACGTPFVASDLGGILDIARQGCGGLTFTTGSLNGFTETIDRLLSQQGLWDGFSKLGYRWVNSQCRTDYILRKWSCLYEYLETTKKWQT